jgi:FMN phosphatase YigB (HAD superfamily)
MEEPPEFELVTFDCYGTLIDWETEIPFKQALEGMGLNESQEAELFELYQEEEKRIESPAALPEIPRSSGAGCCVYLELPMFICSKWDARH